MKHLRNLLAALHERRDAAVVITATAGVIILQLLPF